jgi:hypothetical protein
MIGALSNAQPPIRVRLSVADSRGKKTDEGTVMSSSAPKSNRAAVAESPETRTRTPATPATPKEASDITSKCTCKISFCGSTQKLRHFIDPAASRPLLAAAAQRFPHLNVGVFAFATPSVSFVRLG